MPGYFQTRLAKVNRRLGTFFINVLRPDCPGRTGTVARKRAPGKGDRHRQQKGSGRKRATLIAPLARVPRVGAPAKIAVLGDNRTTLRPCKYWNLLLTITCGCFKMTAFSR